MEHPLLHDDSDRHRAIHLHVGHACPWYSWFLPRPLPQNKDYAPPGAATGKQQHYASNLVWWFLSSMHPSCGRWHHR